MTMAAATLEAVTASWILILLLLGAGCATGPIGKTTILLQTDPKEARFQAILAADNAAIKDILVCLDQNSESIKANPVTRSAFRNRARQQMLQVRGTYERFLQDNPDHTRARNAYASFLRHIGDEKLAEEHWNQILASDEKNAAVHNNLARHLVFTAIEQKNASSVPRAFELIGKAIVLDSKQSLYHHNLATTICLYPNEAAQYFQRTPIIVLEMALKEYQAALKLDPKNFTIASELAESYLQILPIQTESAATAWKHALQLAQSERQKDSVHLNIAILEFKTGNRTAARQSLLKVSDKYFSEMKVQLQKQLSDSEKRR